MCEADFRLPVASWPVNEENDKGNITSVLSLRYFDGIIPKCSGFFSTYAQTRRCDDMNRRMTRIPKDRRSLDTEVSRKLSLFLLRFNRPIVGPILRDNTKRRLFTTELLRGER